MKSADSKICGLSRVTSIFILECDVISMLLNASNHSPLMCQGGSREVKTSANKTPTKCVTRCHQREVRTCAL